MPSLQVCRLFPDVPRLWENGSGIIITASFIKAGEKDYAVKRKIFIWMPN
jgi:hypothetical protein